MTDTDKPTINEVRENLTGYHEEEINRHFGIDPHQGGKTEPVKWVRGLAYSIARHAGSTEDEALKSAMGKTLTQVYDLFGEDDELDPDEPETAGGKDDSPTVSEPPN